MTDRARPPIVFFGNDWAAENRTSSHHIARWLAHGRTVYYIECPGLRVPRGSGRDLKKIWTKLVGFLRGPRSVPEGLHIWTLLQIPLHRFRFVRWLNRRLMLCALHWLILSRRLRGPVAWFMLPHLSSIVGRMGESLAVYYCIDDYAAMPDVDLDAVRAMDEEMTRKADLVFVASATLFDRKARLNPNTHISPHGVDLDHFVRARDTSRPIPDDIRDLGRPVIGFFGLIERWIDLDLIEFLATQRPDWQFVLIGRTAVPAESVPKRTNVHLLGVRPYEVLPQYGRQFDVAIIPYRLNGQTINANPIKLREYLAMGKSVVSVRTPEIEKYADVVRVADTREEFLAHLDAAVAEQPIPSEVGRRLARVAPETWDARLRHVTELVDAHSHRPLTCKKRPLALARSV